MSPRLFLLKAAACIFCAALIVIRIRVSGSGYFSFMLWNLFLAGLPLVFALLLPRTRQFSRALPVLAVWLLFFPNAPYVLTDLIHLRPRDPVPLWFDLSLLLAFAFTSLWLGFQSLRLVQQWFARHFSNTAGWVGVLLVMPLTGFGVYIGRFWRWNSWDLLTRPSALLRSISAPVLDPVAHASLWQFTAVFSALLLLAYLGWIFASSDDKKSA